MRWLLMVAFALTVGCTKPNPNRCCNDEADCTAKGIPVGSTCEQGLVCRGNQCIAQPCVTSEECDPAAPYCVNELCAEACTADTECPGHGQTGLPYCEAAVCVACRSSDQCDPATPVCDNGACRECREHADCSSALCNRDTGMCIPESETAYAIEAGSTSSSCTKQEPCTLERAIAVTDTTRTNVRLLSDLNPNAVIQLNSSDSLPEKLSIFGDHATTVPAFSLSSSTGTFVVRDVALAESYGIECSVGDPAKPNTLIDVARSTLYGLFGARCDIVLNGVTVIRGADTAISLSGGARLTMDRSEVIGGSPSIALFDSSEVQITNSIIRDPVNGAAFAFSAEALQSSVSFTTFYNAHWSCSDGPVVFAASNNVFLYEKAGAPANVVSGTQCRHTYSLIKPQSATPNGSNNLLDMDPRFVNGAGGDFHLIAGSPAIDAADAAATNAVDFEGTARPQGAGRDLGAFEYKP